MCAIVVVLPVFREVCVLNCKKSPKFGVVEADLRQ